MRSQALLLAGVLLVSACGSETDAVRQADPTIAVPTSAPTTSAVPSTPAGDYCKGTALPPRRQASVTGLSARGEHLFDAALPDPDDSGQTAPVTDGRSVWVSAQGELRRLDASNGAQEWVVATTGRGDGLWLVGGVLVALLGQVTSSPSIVGIDPETGSELWRHSPGSILGQALLTGDGGLAWARIGVGTQVLDLATGSLRWSQPGPRETYALAVADGLVLRGIGTRIVAYDSRSGTTRWSSAAVLNNDQSLAVVGSVVVPVAFDTPEIPAVSLSDGHAAWSITGRYLSIVAAGPAGLLLRDGDGSGSRRIRLVSPRGTTRFAVAGFPDPSGDESIVGTDDVVEIEGATGGELVSRSLDGTVRWTVDLGGSSRDLTEAGATLVLTTVLPGKDQLHLVQAFDRATGNVRWRTSVTGYPTAVRALGDGVVVQSQDPAYGCAD